ncbi:hypothetical protein PHPALM_30598 [Phytophthora palmivora]|uniref:Uncharacterized protein n=1 Tax=Phytophthora palmivora TaxID=4796 RepID=A0A2P4X4R7_9STRA|nr:hypothetical protein PHPALM_30598 [Phytophthora palmivora]
MEPMTPTTNTQAGMTAGCGGEVDGSSSIASPTRIPPPLLQDVYLEKLVAFSPTKEPWMKQKVYRCAATAYIVGRVSVIQRGIENYKRLVQLPGRRAWKDSTENVADGELSLDAPSDELGISSEFTSTYEIYSPERSLLASFAEVETVKNMRLEPDVELKRPTDLFTRKDESITTRLLHQYRHVFAHSASLGFFAYISIYIWKQVVLETNVPKHQNHSSI